jgi:pimeloyl-ACP methyl ester carboxylesterase
LKSTLIAVAVVLFVLLAFWLWTPDKSRALLESKYLTAPADLIDVTGVKLHVRDSGPKSAPAVILIHGFGASLHTWEPWAKVLAADHRVIRFDLPGSGLSSPDPTGNYTDARSIQVLIALMDKLGVAKASIVGNSIGGRMAWTFAATHPERVDKLVLVSPDGFASRGFEYGKPPEVTGTMKLMRYVLPKFVLKMSLKPAFADPNFLTDELTNRYFDLMLGEGSREALLARMAQTALVDPVPLLKRIQAPTLLLWGEQDHVIPFANAVEYLKTIPNVRLVSLNGVGHLPHEEVPERSIAPLSDFLK